MNRHDFLNRIEGRSERQSREQVSEWRSVASGASECQHTFRRAHWPGPWGTEMNPMMPGPGSTVTTHPSYTSGSLGRTSGHGKGPP